MKTPVVCIMGPTGSGKTALAEKLAVDLDAEIINADMGQFYTALSIGTAKPSYKNTQFKQHLFDICDAPVDFDVKRYRALVINTIEEIRSRGKRVILVGGSLFYIKSLFYPPCDFQEHESTGGENKSDKKYSFLYETSEEGWNFLYTIDPLRASEIHVNDRYRIDRALTLYFSTGRLPSECRPKLQPPFAPFFIWMELEKEYLEKRIALRLENMIAEGWIEEVERNADPTWCSFYEHKGLIGYAAIAAWIRSGKKSSELLSLKEFLFRSTCLYAKRQKTFWKSFLLQFLKEHSFFTLESLFIYALQQDDAERLISSNCSDQYERLLEKLCSFHK